MMAIALRLEDSRRNLPSIGKTAECGAVLEAYRPILQCDKSLLLPNLELPIDTLAGYAKECGQIFLGNSYRVVDFEATQELRVY